MNDSIWNDPRITAYVLDELDDGDRDAFETEMRSNRPLAAAVDEARGIADRLATVYEGEPTPTLDADRRATILATPPTDPASRTDDALSPDTDDALSPDDRTGHALSLDQDVDDALSPAVGEAEGRSGVWWWAAIGLAIAATLLVVVGVTPLQRNVTNVAWNFEADAPRATGEREATLGATADDADALGDAAGDETGVSSFSQAMGEGESLERVPSDAAAPRGLSRLTPLGGPENVPEAARNELAERTQGTKPGQGAERTPGAEWGRRNLPLPTPESAREESPEPFEMALDSPSTARPAEPPKPRERHRPFPADAELYSDLGRDGDEMYGEEIVQDFGAAGDVAAEPYPGTAPAQRGMSEQAGRSQTDGEPEPEPSELKSGTRPEPEVELRFAGDFAIGLSTLPEQATLLPTEKMGGIGGGFGGIGETDRGQGPGMAGDRFDPIVDNPFRRVSEHPLGTFSVDVDTASYAKVRDFLLRVGRLPRPDAVRIEELVNYFDYGYETPADDAEHPFRAGVDLAACPWNPDHHLARVSIQGKRFDAADRPRANLVFLVDTSGSMNAPNRLPLVREGLKSLVDQMDEGDRIAIVTYAGSAGMVLDSTPAGERAAIRRALTELTAGGSTNGGAGITLAYQTARDHFIPDGVNRVVLCSDGDFNVGATGTDELVRTVEQEAKGGVFLTVLGFGMGNHNDAMLEQISGRGNGNYFFIDNADEARKVLVEQAVGTLVTIAKDVKLQIEFNPRWVSAYRLIGYENRVLAAEDFNDDQKDAGEIGAGHSVTLLLELVPAGTTADASPPPVDELRYQTRPELTDAAQGDERLVLKLRYKRPDEETSRPIEVPASGGELAFDQADPGFRFAAAVAGFGMQLRQSPYAGGWTLPDVRQAATDATSAIGDAPQGRRGEFLRMIERAIELTAAEPGTTRPTRGTIRPTRPTAPEPQ